MKRKTSMSDSIGTTAYTNVPMTATDTSTIVLGDTSYTHDATCTYQDDVAMGQKRDSNC